MITEINSISESQIMKLRLQSLYDDYAYVLDEQDLDAWLNFFTEDAHYRVISKENFDANLPLGLIFCMNKNMLRDRVTALRETTMYEPRAMRHFISGMHILGIEADVVRVQANFLITESVSDQEPEISMVGKYQDELVVTEDSVLIRKRDCIYDNYRIRNSLIIPV